MNTILKKKWKYLLIFLFSFFCPQLAFADFTFPNFTGTSALFQANGNASSGIVGAKLRVINNIPVTGTAGSVFYNTAQSLTSNKEFSTAFSFEVPEKTTHSTYSNIPVGDGFTFVIQKNSLTSLGAGGGGLGYAGISNSIAVEFDFITSLSAGDSGIRGSDHHIGIDSAGLVPGQNTTSASLGPVNGFNFLSGIWYAWIDYDGTNMEVRLSTTNSRPTTATTSVALSLSTTSPARLGAGSQNVYVGFTGGEASAGATVNVLSWTFRTFYSPISEISTTAPNIATTHSIAVYDPAVANKKAVPGEDIVNSVTVTNSGGTNDSNTLKIILPVNTNTSFKTGSVSFTDAVGGSASGLTCCSTIEYSNTTSPYTWTYTPTGTYDANVKAVRVTPSGALNDGTSGTVGFRLNYQSQIQ